MYSLRTALLIAALLMLTVWSERPARAQEPSAQAEEESPLRISMDENGRYTVRAMDVRLGEVLAELKAVTGVSMELDPVLEAERVTLDLKGATYEKLMEELAGSHAVVYERGTDGKYRVVSVRLTSQQKLARTELDRKTERDVERKKREVAQTLSEVEKIYGFAGELNYDQAKALFQDRAMRFQALVDALAALGPGGARAMLEMFGEAGSTRGKLAMIEALGKIEDEEAALALGALYEQNVPFSLQREIIGSLGRQGGESTLSVLKGMLSGETDERLVGPMSQALISGGEGALGTLGGVIYSETQTMDARQEAVHSVGVIGGDQARNMLAEISLGASPTVLRRSAIQELGRSFGASALPALETLLEDSDEGISAIAVKAIARVKTDEAKELLQKAAESHPVPAVRDLAKALLPAEETPPP